MTTSPTAAIIRPDYYFCLTVTVFTPKTHHIYKFRHSASRQDLSTSGIPHYYRSSWRTILILSSYLRLSLQVLSWLWFLLPNIVAMSLPSHISHILVHFTSIISSSFPYKNHHASRYVVFSSLLLLPPPEVRFSRTPIGAVHTTVSAVLLSLKSKHCLWLTSLCIAAV